ncbi:MAG: OmpH family outer membrane protein, partial [Paludibacteraceae bacterium]|nr:OmpH family outer membrane protein [Paludibacteraceae bacterium]
MLKKLFIAALLALPFGVMAQELKIATVNTQEIISVYPAYADANSQLEKQSKQYEDELLKLNQEGQKKLEEYQKLAEDKNTDPAILKAREDEIGALQQRIQLFQQSAREQLQKKQEQLMAPIITAVRNAISEVGNEGKYTFIL